MFNDFNPHIFDTIAGIRNEAEVARLLKLSGGNQPDFKMLLHEFGVKIMAAEKFLRRERELTGMFPGAMPLAYKLNPTLRKMKQDDLSKAKFGGIPNLAGLLSSVET